MSKYTFKIPDYVFVLLWSSLSAKVFIVKWFPSFNTFF